MSATQSALATPGLPASQQVELDPKALAEELRRSDEQLVKLRAYGRAPSPSAVLPEQIESRPVLEIGSIPVAEGHIGVAARADSPLMKLMKDELRRVQVCVRFDAFEGLAPGQWQNANEADWNYYLVSQKGEAAILKVRIYNWSDFAFDGVSLTLRGNGCTFEAVDNECYPNTRCIGTIKARSGPFGPGESPTMTFKARATRDGIVTITGSLTGTLVPCVSIQQSLASATVVGVRS